MPTDKKTNSPDAEAYRKWKAAQAAGLATISAKYGTPQPGVLEQPLGVPQERSPQIADYPKQFRAVGDVATKEYAAWRASRDAATGRDSAYVPSFVNQRNYASMNVPPSASNMANKDGTPLPRGQAGFSGMADKDNVTPLIDKSRKYAAMNVPGSSSNMANKDGEPRVAAAPGTDRMAYTDHAQNLVRPANAGPRQQAPAPQGPLGARQPGVPMEEPEQQGPQDIGAAGRAKALRAQFDMEQQKFIRDKQAGLIKYGSPEDLAGRQRLFALSDERKQYDLAARAPSKVLSPTQNAAASQRVSGQAAEIIGQDINAARAAGQDTSGMESRLSGLQQKNIGMTREEAIASGLKMAGGTGMGGMLAAGQDVQEGLKKVAPSWMAKGEEYTAMQKNRAVQDVEAAKEAAGRAGDMTAKRNDAEAYARDMETGQKDLTRGELALRLAAQQADAARYGRVARGESEPLGAVDQDKLNRYAAETGLYKAQAESEARKYGPGGAATLGDQVALNKVALEAAGITPEKMKLGQEAVTYLTQMMDEPVVYSGDTSKGYVGGSGVTRNASEAMPRLELLDSIIRQIESIENPQARAQAAMEFRLPPAGDGGQYQALDYLNPMALAGRSSRSAVAAKLNELNQRLNALRG